MIKEIYKYLFNKSTMLLNRNQLGSINLSAIKRTEEEKKELSANIATSYKYIKEIIDELVQEQTEFMARKCENEEQLLFARGTVNGLLLVRDDLGRLKGQHDEETKPKDFNKFSIS